MSLVIVGLILLVIGAVTAQHTAGLVSTLAAITAAAGFVLIIVGLIVWFAPEADAASMGVIA